MNLPTSLFASSILILLLPCTTPTRPPFHTHHQHHRHSILTQTPFTNHHLLGTRPNSHTLAAGSNPGGNPHILAAVSGPNPGGNARILAAGSGSNPGGNMEILGARSGPNPGGNSRILAAISGPNPGGNAHVLAAASGANPEGNMELVLGAGSAPIPGGHSRVLAAGSGSNPGGNMQSLAQQPASNSEQHPTTDYNPSFTDQKPQDGLPRGPLSPSGPNPGLSAVNVQAPYLHKQIIFSELAKGPVRPSGHAASLREGLHAGILTAKLSVSNKSMSHAHTDAIHDMIACREDKAEFLCKHETHGLEHGAVDVVFNHHSSPLQFGVATATSPNL